MQITPISANIQNNKPSFGHSFRVNICVVKPEGNGYDFVSPATNTKLYKKLNSKFINWLNEGFIERLRLATKTPRKAPKKESYNDSFSKSVITKGLSNADSDYRSFGIARSVYDRFGLGYVVTGVDVPVIENLKGATLIGRAKGEALLSGQDTHSPYIDEIVKQFKKGAKQYVQDPINLLRSKKGKELMLDLNFRKSGVDAKGQDIYELDNFKFHEIQKSQTMDVNEVEAKRAQRNLTEEVRKTIKHQIKSITGKNPTEKQIDDVMNFDPTPPKRKRVPKNFVPKNQLLIQFPED